MKINFVSVRGCSVLQAAFLFLLFFTSYQLVNAQWMPTSGPDGGWGTHVVVHGSKIFASASASGLFVSANDGATWNYVGFTNRYINGLVSYENFLFVTTTFGVNRSSDDGATWTLVNNGLTGAGTVGTALYLQGTTLFAGTVSGIYSSTDHGNTWTFKGLANKQIRNITGNSDRLFAGGSVNDGVFVSSDHGEHWESTNLPDPGTTAFSITSFGNTIFVNTGSKLYRSLNNGNQWTVVGSELNGNGVSDMVMDGTLLFAATYGGLGIMVSSDNGATFTNANFKYGQVESFAIKDNVIFAASLLDGILISKDHGKNWISSIAGMKGQQINSFVKKGNTFLASSIGGIFISEDKGDHWWKSISEMADQPATILFPQALCFSGTNIIAGSLTRGAVISTDNGISWRLTNLTGTVRSLIVKDTYVFAGTDRGIYISNNNGATWTSMGLTDQSIKTFFVFKDKIYAGTDGSGLFASQNNGVSWTAMNSGLTSFIVNVLGSNGGLLYAGTSNGLFRSNDEGATWTVVSGQQANRVIVAIASLNGVLCISTDTGVDISTNDGQSWQSWSGKTPYPYTISFAFGEDNAVYAGSYNSVIKRQLVTVSSVSPSAAVIGTTIKITGEFFSSTASDNIVKFNGLQATVVSASFNELSVIVPPGATTGPVSVTVGNRAAGSENNFTVNVNAVDNNTTTGNNNVITGDIDESTEDHEMVLYPNPANDFILLDHVPYDTPFVIQISNSFGQQIHQQFITRKRLAPLDVSHFASGLYIFRIIKDEKTYSLKFVKK